MSGACAKALAIDTNARESVDEPNRRARLGTFLRAKRAAISPERFDLPVFRRRRVPGLRREEIALLAGISVAWYTQLESGAPIAVSPALIRRIADILELNALERAYVFTLAFEELSAVEAVLPELELLAAARIGAETFDDEIALVLRTHRTLKVQVYSALVHGTIDLLLPQLDEARCPIGLWLHDGLAPARKHDAHYNRAARIHAAFHHEIDKLVAAGLAGTPAQIERLIVAPSRYVSASAALERTFSGWKQRAAAPRGNGSIKRAPPHAGDF
jgi:transcriptional regulator with XRE-family HTH domain